MSSSAKPCWVSATSNFGAARDLAAALERHPAREEADLPGGGSTPRQAVGNGADLWVRMQGADDTWHAQRKVDTSKIPTIKAA